MLRFREHIDRPDLFESIACGGKELTVTGEGCRVAGNIGNTGNAACNYGLDGFRVGALSRWVKDEGGKILLFGSQKLRNDILHGSADEFGIGDAVFTALAFAFSMAEGTTSMPSTCFALFAASREIVPIPQ